VANDVAPHAPESERIVLSELLNRPEALDEVNLVSEQFYSEANRSVFAAIVGLTALHREIDAGSVATWLRDQGRLEQVGGTVYLLSLLNEVPAASVVEHAGVVREKWRQRAFVEICRRHVVLGRDAPVEDVQAAIEAAEHDIGELSHTVECQELIAGGVVARKAVDEIKAAREEGRIVSGISTGFVDLDRVVAGLHRGDQVIVAGRPGMGKTSLVTSLILNVSRKPEPGMSLPYATAFFSLEMPAHQIALRLACAEGGAPVSAVRSGRMGAGEFAALDQGVDRMMRIPVYIDDTPSLTIMAIRSRLRRLRRRIQAGAAEVPAADVALAVVDYIQLCRGPGDNREQEVAKLSRDLKEMAKSENVAVVACSQLNRAVENRGKDKKPQLSDLRESGAIEQDADSVWFVHRKGYYDPLANQREADIIIAKQRNGPTGEVTLDFDGRLTLFRNSAQHETSEYVSRETRVGDFSDEYATHL
jgi:replicative DNA helicase